MNGDGHGSVIPTWLVTLIVAMLAQVGTAVWWGSRIESRVDTIETRGSPQAETIGGRMIALEFRVNKIDEATAVLRELDKRLDRVEGRIGVVIDSAQDNAKKLDMIGRTISQRLPPPPGQNGSPPKSGDWQP